MQFVEALPHTKVLVKRQCFFDAWHFLISEKQGKHIRLPCRKLFHVKQLQFSVQFFLFPVCFSLSSAVLCFCTTLLCIAANCTLPRRKNFSSFSFLRQLKSPEIPSTCLTSAASGKELPAQSSHRPWPEQCQSRPAAR